MATETQIQEEITILDLGDKAKRLNSNFACGGSLPQLISATIFFKKQPGEWSLVPLNVPSDTAEETTQEFLNACSPASFGRGNENVVLFTSSGDEPFDPAVEEESMLCGIMPRTSAGVLEASFCNFDVANTNILIKIANVMAVGSSIRTELYQLNIYSTGGHFKAHVDTPRSKEMFGSLVVCLPSAFTGGELVARHRGQEMKFDWSSLPTTTHWAAFFSDIEHEVYPVTSGHRITLTFNLYHIQPPQPAAFSIDVSATPLYKTMSAALANPHFMREGGTLGFFCSYKYVETTSCGERAWDGMQGNDPNFLKGEDMIIYQVAKSFGLPVSINPVCRELDKGERSTWKGEKFYVLPKFGHQTTSWDYGGERDLLDSDVSDDIYLSDKIEWCEWFDQLDEPAVSSAHYGNEVSTVMFYQAAALLIKVPKYSSGRGKASPCATSGSSGKDLEV